MPKTSTYPVAQIGLESRLAGSDAIYFYLAEKDTKVGDAYVVPLGARKVVGFVLSRADLTEEELGFPAKSLKPLGAKVDGLDLSPGTVELLKEVSRQTLTSISTCLTLVTPPLIMERLVTRYELTSAADESPEDLSTAMQEMVSVLRSERIVEKKGKSIPQGTKSTLRALIRRGLVEQKLAVEPVSERLKQSQTYRLTPDQEKIDKFLIKAGKKKPAQAITVMRLQGSEAASFTIDELKALSQVSVQTINALVTSGLLIEVEPKDIPRSKPPKLNEEQQVTCDTIKKSIDLGEFHRFLLYGITGSGKTEVYLSSAEEALRQGRQVLYLVPEIALTAQVIAQLRTRFGAQVAIIHSNLAQGDRLDNWEKIRSGKAPVILGARSALFAPFSHLGLIIVDEEHESSYKQESAPRYHARKIATYLAKAHQCPIVSGSATPAIESYYEAQTGKQTLLTLRNRAVAKATLPEVHLADLTEVYKASKATIFTPLLQDLMTQTLDRDEQVILFLNRRAYSRFVVCRDCGKDFTCPHCSIALCYHMRENSLRCHHCGYRQAAPKTCPDCQSERVGSFGVGSEKVEEAVALQFPKARVSRLDRDVARRSGALEEVLARFRSHETNVLVGTQMVAKGLDFPRVTLVGVIAADISLNVPDFRSSERTFQLLSQVAGRSGRGDRPGQVVIQTLNPHHPSVVASQNHDYEALYTKLIEERRLGYPPFNRLVNIVFTGENRDAVYQLSGVAGQRLKSIEGIVALGPANCPFERLQGKYRRHILVKMEPDSDPTPIQDALAGLSAAKTRIVIDVDPVSLL